MLPEMRSRFAYVFWAELSELAGQLPLQRLHSLLLAGSRLTRMFEESTAFVSMRVCPWKHRQDTDWALCKFTL